MRIDVLEEDRQLIIIALAHLAAARPGWKPVLQDVAIKYKGEETFTELRMFFEYYASCVAANATDFKKE